MEKKTIKDSGLLRFKLNYSGVARLGFMVIPEHGSLSFFFHFLIFVFDLIGL